MIDDRRTTPLPQPQEPNTVNSPTPTHYGVAFEKLCRLFLTHYCRLEVRGTLPPAGGPYLICSNHRSHLDSLAIMTAAGLPFHSCGLLAAQDYFFRNPIWLRFLSPALQLIPVNRRPHAHEFNRTIESCAAFLRDGGKAIIAYPEGTRGQSSNVSTFKRGAGILAMRLRVPILPVFVSGTDLVMPKDRIIPRLGCVVVHFGPLMDIKKSEQPGHEKEYSMQLTKQIETRVRDLCSQGDK